jgi:hypothetical protein
LPTAPLTVQTDDRKNGLEATSRLADKIGVKTGSVISVTTKIAKARANKQP